MAATGLAGRLRRLLPPSRARVPAGPPLGEVAAASIAGRLQPYIGELPLNPRQPSRYADRYRDEGHALQIYRDILRDERCQAALDQRLDAAIARPWTVEPGGDTPEDRAAADDLARQLAGIGFDAVSRQLLHGVWYGYAIAEALWARDADRVVLDRLVVRAPDRFRWSAEGQPLLRTETLSPWARRCQAENSSSSAAPASTATCRTGRGSRAGASGRSGSSATGSSSGPSRSKSSVPPASRARIRGTRAPSRRPTCWIWSSPSPQTSASSCPRGRRSRSSRARAAPAGIFWPSSPISTAPYRRRSSGSPPPPTWGPGAAPPRCSATCATKPSPPTAACSTAR